MRTAEVCDNERRRSDVRESQLRGLDYIEVSDDQRTLTVYFLGKAPCHLGPENIRIEGGQRVRNIQVLSVDVYHEEDDELDDYMQITVDRSGDFSTYTLRMVEIKGYDKNHVPLYRCMRGFDDRYASVQFSFKINCPSDLDYKTDKSCSLTVYEHPEISYLAKDYASFRQLMLDRLALNIPGWQEQHIPDIGIALVEILAYVGDYLSYYQDAIATEAYLGTAQQRISVRRHARLVDYDMHEGCNARTWIHVKISPEVPYKTEIKINPKDIYFITGNNDALDVNSTMLTDGDVQKLSASDYEAFERLFEGKFSLVEDTHYLQLYKAHNEIRFYTWGNQECCLPSGAISASLQDYAYDPYASPDLEEELYIQSEIAQDELLEEDEGQEPSLQQQTSQVTQSAQEPQPRPQDTRVLHLVPGDFLLFEEVRGSKTGLASDTVMSHRHVVRLTKVEEVRDHLYGKNVLEVSWAAEDALPFPLCISSVGQAPDCKLLQNISVARGNLLLVDNGLTIYPAEDLGKVQEGISTPVCEGENQPSDVQVIAEPFYPPPLSKFPLTFSQKLEKKLPASQVLKQDVRQARPNITLTGKLQILGTDKYISNTWYPQQDLLESGPEDRAFVVEIDNDSHAHLRFGDGETGRAPAPNEQFTAIYRIGNGPAGNVGAEAITHIVFRQNMPKDIMLIPRNPFAAVGGTAPEPIAEVKQLAPYAFRDVLERAITADDYVQLLKGYPGMQRSAASLRWNGSGYNVLIAIDPLGSEELSTSLREKIMRYLEQFRRIGHDIAVEQAHYVPIELELCVVVQSHYLRGHVKADLIKRFSNRLHSDGTKGFFHPDNLRFGDNIAVSTLVALAQAVPGVQSVAVKKLERFGEGPNQELAKGVLEIRSLEIAQLDNDPSFPEHGKLTLDMKGGR